MAGEAAGRRRVAAPVLRVLVLSPLLLAAAKSVPDPAQSLAGRYYRQFPNALVSGEKYTGENIVEVVPVGPRAAYFRVDLSYFNGHSCQIFGVARSEGDRLVYRDPSRPYEDEPSCVLTVTQSGRSLTIDDGDGTCHMGHCGMRGTLSRVSLPYASKRTIRYLPRLKASDEYRWALAEWRTGTPIRDQWTMESPPAPEPNPCGDNCAM